ncbi:MAG: hypothetical protein ABIP77_07670 [Candidatus Limnocylindrales bacterium]
MPGRRSVTVPAPGPWRPSRAHGEGSLAARAAVALAAKQDEDIIQAQLAVDGRIGRVGAHGVHR